MSKLITPVQFEPSLDGLNIVRPLLMPDEGKTVISYPVLCKTLPSEGKPGVGKLARCSHQGALLKDNTEFADSFLEAELYLTSENNSRTILLPRIVKAVALKHTTVGTPGDTFWTDSSFYHKYMTLSGDFQFSRFKARRMYFRSECEEEEDYAVVIILGFY